MGVFFFGAAPAEGWVGLSRSSLFARPFSRQRRLRSGLTATAAHPSAAGLRPFFTVG
ncbi:hypothetical protein SGRA_3294 [Saprospira grandis str. Lewin]|uniref:Uncharacterized protein n=1 Tax=Saprospira grandis (strain Lewin) TaxID=984262 RepID=H6L014_SAPGL|nr:hypothetical protein SGRA_3294 [Saprospira grandis str. Lewin]